MVLTNALPSNQILPYFIDTFGTPLVLIQLLIWDGHTGLMKILNHIHIVEHPQLPTVEQTRTDSQAASAFALLQAFGRTKVLSPVMWAGRLHYKHFDVRAKMCQVQIKYKYIISKYDSNATSELARCFPVVPCCCMLFHFQLPS